MSKGWKNTVIILIVIIAVLGGLFAWLGWSGSTKDIVAAADQFQVPNSWKLVDNTAVPPKTFCIDNTCPSVTRTWQLPEPLTQKNDIEKVAKLDNQSFTIGDNCFSKTGSSDYSDFCEATTQHKGYLLTLTYREFNDTPTATIVVKKS